MSTTAWPFSLPFMSSANNKPATLQTRQAGTFDHPYAEDGPAVAGWMHCFKGGTWMHQSILNSTVDQACTQTSFDKDAQHFNFTLDPLGKNAVQTVTHRYRHCDQPQQFGVNAPECGNADDDFVKYGAYFATGTFANTTSCRYGLDLIIRLCVGDNGYSRGGWFQFDADTTTYNVDPSNAQTNQ